MRILTILLLPLLFVATSCDSGGEGSACAVDPTGTWEFTQFDLSFSYVFLSHRKSLPLNQRHHLELLGDL